MSLRVGGAAAPTAPSRLWSGPSASRVVGPGPTLERWPYPGVHQDGMSISGLVSSSTLTSLKVTTWTDLTKRLAR